MQDVSIVVAALRDVVQVDPWLAALWLSCAIALAGLIVYAWQRLLRR
jgi:hypothetical protein